MPLAKIDSQLYEEHAVRSVAGSVAVVNFLGGLGISAHDYISFTYTKGNLTGAVFKSGGSGGSTVATLALVYDANNNITSITKT